MLILIAGDLIFILNFPSYTFEILFDLTNIKSIQISLLSEYIYIYIYLDLILVKKIISFVIYFICFKFILNFAHTFSARANVITHIVNNWLFRHALLSTKTIPFLKG